MAAHRTATIGQRRPDSDDRTATTGEGAIGSERWTVSAKETAPPGAIRSEPRRSEPRGVSQGESESTESSSGTRTQVPVFGEGMASEEAGPARKVIAAGEAMRRDTRVREAVVVNAIPAEAAGAGPREREGMGLENGDSGCEHRAVGTEKRVRPSK